MTELFIVRLVYASSYSMFMSVDPKKKKKLKEQAKEFGPYIQYIMEENAPIPVETIASMRHSARFKTESCTNHTYQDT